MFSTFSHLSAPPALNRYERARVLGVRALQISGGARVCVKTTQTDSLAIAREELAQNALTFSIVTNSLCGTTTTHYGGQGSTSAQQQTPRHSPSDASINCPLLEQVMAVATHNAPFVG